MKFKTTILIEFVSDYPINLFPGPSIDRGRVYQELDRACESTWNNRVAVKNIATEMIEMYPGECHNQEPPETK